MISGSRQVRTGETLSEKSIPFYYAEDGDRKPKMLPVWNSDWHRQGKL
jgi:hypothetical protein